MEYEACAASLISLNSVTSSTASSRSGSPSPSLAPPPSSTRPSEPDATHSLENSQASDPPAAAAHDPVQERRGDDDGPTSPHDPLDPFSATPTAPLHPLASFLLANESPPASPALSARSSQVKLAGSGGGGGVTAGAGWGRGRSRSSTSGSASGHSGTSDTPSHHQLVFPSPSFRLPSPAAHPRQPSAHRSIDPIRSRVLILGRTNDERRQLATLLSTPDDSIDNEVESTEEDRNAEEEDDATTDLSSSMLSDARTSSAHQPDLNPFEDLPIGAPNATFSVPGRLADQSELVRALERPLERLEAFLNPEYPSTLGLADLVSSQLAGEFEACLMLFSAPPLPSEVHLARQISHLLPLHPILILPPPPSPTSKPQKTAQLILAVRSQLTRAGVRFSSPPSSSSTATLHVLSLPTPPLDSPDLARLRSLTGTLSARQRLLSNHVLSFLEWREIEVAARGKHQVLSIESWSAAQRMTGGEQGVEEGEQGPQLALDYSRRVAERRIEMRGRGTERGSVLEEGGGIEAFAYEVRRQREDSFRSSTTTSSSAADSDGDSIGNGAPISQHSTFRESILLNDPTTPRCSQRSPPLFPLPPSSSSDTPSSYFPLTPPSPPLSTFSSSNSFLLHPQALHDPFHLPSLLHLVGLNLRLALLPPPVLAGVWPKNGYYERAGSWIGTAALCSLLFLAGVAVGSGKVTFGGAAGVGVWRNALVGFGR